MVLDEGVEGELLAIDDSTTLWEADIRYASYILQYCHFNIFFEDLEGRTIELQLREIAGLEEVNAELSDRLADRYPEEEAVIDMDSFFVFVEDG